MPEPYSDAARILGERIRTIRHQIAFNQEDVANLAEMNVSNYGKIERGRANPNLTTIVRIAAALNADPGALITGIPLDSVPGRVHQLTAADFIRERQKRGRAPGEAR